MADLWQVLEMAWGRFDPGSVLDILLMAFIIYWLLLLLRGTTAVAVVRGVVSVLLLGFALSSLLGLTMVGWLLRNSFTALLIAIPIVFQPELLFVM